MPSVSNLRRGMAILYNNDIFLITEYHQSKQGRQAAVIRTKLKNVKTGRVVENTFRITDKIEQVRLDDKDMQFLYGDGESFHFMDTETYDQIAIPSDMVGDQAKFMKEGQTAKILFYGEEAITMELPNNVDLEVTEAEPAVRGDTAGNLTKQITLETGATIQVPPFIKQGEVIKVDTRTGTYVSRS